MAFYFINITSGSPIIIKKSFEVHYKYNNTLKHTCFHKGIDLISEYQLTGTKVWYMSHRVHWHCGEQCDKINHLLISSSQLTLYPESDLMVIVTYSYSNVSLDIWIDTDIRIYSTASVELYVQFNSTDPLWLAYWWPPAIWSPLGPLVSLKCAVRSFRHNTNDNSCCQSGYCLASLI